MYTENSSYEGDTSKIHFDTLRITNKGESTANNVIVNINFKTTSIIEYSITNIENVLIDSKQSDSEKIILNIKSIIPSEELIINILKSNSIQPKIFIKSEKSLATEDKSKDSESNFSKYLEKSLEIFLSIFVFCVLFYFISQKRTPLEKQSANNSAFIMLHTGLLNEATGTLITAIQGGDHSAYAFSNIATCYALKNDLERSDSFLNGASFTLNNSHEKSILKFNYGIIEAIKGNKENSIRLLKESTKIPMSSTKKYIKISSIIKNLFTEDEIEKILN